jgi:hypothetical protein
VPDADQVVKKPSRDQLKAVMKVAVQEEDYENKST